MMKSTLLIILSLITSISFSQVNLVPNSTFERVGKKIKEKGGINVAMPWSSPTLVQADLYVPKTKNFLISIPKNIRGEEKPMEGSGYAGIVAYSYKSKVPRSYLQVQLAEKLEEGKDYCVKYHVSLADLSKYSCNRLGVAITTGAVTANNSNMLKINSFIESKTQQVYETQFYWTPICGVYKAKGGEEYLTIGNFTEDADMKIKKVRKPRGFTKPQTYDAYYYVDNVSVMLAEDSEKCDCSVASLTEMKDAEIVKKDFGSKKGVNVTTIKIVNTDGTIITEGPDNRSVNNSSSLSSLNGSDGVDGMIIKFQFKQSSIAVSIGDLNKVVAYMKKNAGAKITITGHIDESEKEINKLAERRVGSVYKYLVSKGLTKERIARKSRGTDSPIDKKDISKNMRVEISVTSK